jgi:hypothetical protein
MRSTRRSRNERRQLADLHVLLERTTGFEPASLTLANRPEQISDQGEGDDNGSDLP